MIKRKPSSLQIDESFNLNNVPVLISGCLLGLRCRYDGTECGSSDLIRLASSIHFIPVCPEQLGGLSTPRSPAGITGGDGRDVLSGKAKVINREGEDVTGAFRKGAEEALKLARLAGVEIAFLKNRSPSCGLLTPYCETASGSGKGVAAALLDLSGIRVIEIDPAVPLHPHHYKNAQRFYKRRK